MRVLVASYVLVLNRMTCKQLKSNYVILLLRILSSFLLLMGWNRNFSLFLHGYAIAAAKSLQSCLILCDHMDGSPPGSPRPWDSPGKNTGVGCHFLLQCTKVKSESEAAQSCPTLRDPVSMGLSRQEYWSGLPFPSPMHESEKWKWSCSVVSDSSRPRVHGAFQEEYWSGSPLPSPYMDTVLKYPLNFCFSSIQQILICLFIFIKFRMWSNFLISWMTHVLFRNASLRFKVFEHFPGVYLLLTSNSISLWSAHIISVT